MIPFARRLGGVCLATVLTGTKRSRAHSQTSTSRSERCRQSRRRERSRTPLGCVASRRHDKPASARSSAILCALRPNDARTGCTTSPCALDAEWSSASQ